MADSRAARARAAPLLFLLPPGRYGRSARIGGGMGKGGSPGTRSHREVAEAVGQASAIEEWRHSKKKTS
eukprot:scaffold187307_cov26-Tisochrysis_lutea.AAC.3